MKLSKEKRNQLILSLFGTVAIVAGLWFTLIRYQQAGLKRLAEQATKSDFKLQQISKTIKNSTAIEAELVVVSNKLATKEDDMASGDLYSAMISSVSKFKQTYDVEIPQFNSAGAAVDVNVLPRFPYKQVTVNVAGTAYYYDIGQFVADFENRFPCSRVLNLELIPASAQSPGEREKLSFKMDIVSLVKSSGTR